jgi:hypothetical protein
MSDTPTPAALPAPAEAARPAWHQNPALRALVAFLVGVAIAAACPFLPARAQPVCHAVANAISRADLSQVPQPEAHP